MHFPASKRVAFDRNPIVEVICQVRFPQLLEVDSPATAIFLAKLESEFPRNVVVQVPHFTGAPPDIQVHQRSEYQLRDESSTRRVTLSNNSLSLQVQVYERWEDFSSLWNTVYLAFISTYQVSSLTRVGLRYQDIIARSELSLTDVPWSELLSAIVAPLALSETSWLGFEAKYLKDLGSHRLANLRSCLLTDAETNEQVFLIDGDVYTEAPSNPDAAMLTGLLNEFNVEAGNLFRWCLLPRLQAALGPKEFY